MSYVICLLCVLEYPEAPAVSADDQSSEFPKRRRTIWSPRKEACCMLGIRTTPPIRKKAPERISRAASSRGNEDAPRRPNYCFELRPSSSPTVRCVAILAFFQVSACQRRDNARARRAQEAWPVVRLRPSDGRPNRLSWSDCETAIMRSVPLISEKKVGSGSACPAGRG